MRQNLPLEGQIAVVTGASRGIGYATALELARAGAHVVAIARTSGGLEELDDEIRQHQGTATLVPMDLMDFDAIDRLGASLYERYGRLDILIGNAAILGGLSPLGHIDPKLWERVLATNLTANWRLIRALDPLLRKAASGRAVFITSSVAQSCKAFWGAYAVSKAGLEAMIRIWADETRNIGEFKVNLFNPGAVRTHMRAQAMPGENPDTLPRPDQIAPHILRLCARNLDCTGRVYEYPRQQFLGVQPIDLAPHSPR